METLTKRSFTINAESKEELLDRLLELNNYNRAKFASYMGIEADILADAPKWAINYLSDLLEANLIHLGYVAKDAKHEGAFGEYDEAVAELDKLENERQDTQPPIIIDKEYIISPVRTLKVSILTNSMKMIRDYIENLEELE